MKVKRLLGACGIRLSYWCLSEGQVTLAAVATAAALLADVVRASVLGAVDAQIDGRFPTDAARVLASSFHLDSVPLDGLLRAGACPDSDTRHRCASAAITLN